MFKSIVSLSTCLQWEISKLNQSSRTLSRASWGMLKIWESMWVILDCCSLPGTRLLVPGILTRHGSDDKWFTFLKTLHYWDFASWWSQKCLMKPGPISLEAGDAYTTNFKSVFDLWVKYSESHWELGEDNYYVIWAADFHGSIIYSGTSFRFRTAYEVTLFCRAKVWLTVSKRL